MSEDAIITLVAVSVGWGLAVLTDTIKESHKRRRLLAALLIEVEDVGIHFVRVCTSVERSLQIFALGGLDNSLPLSIPHHIFLAHYSDVCAELNRAQRQSYEFIHG